MQNKRTNKEIGEACARRIAEFNKATYVENKPSREGASYAERVIDARAYIAARQAKIVEYIQKKQK